MPGTHSLGQRKDGAAGVDGQTAAAYEEKLEDEEFQDFLTSSFLPSQAWPGARHLSPEALAKKFSQRNMLPLR